jgi:iron uptake system component EfeO
MPKSKRNLVSRWLISAAFACLAACSDDAGDDQAPDERATLDVKSYIETELDDLADAAASLQESAPVPDADGWNAIDDKAAVDEMRAIWSDMRDSYERVEGSIAILFEPLDVSTDERYDGFIAEDPDANLFDGEGVTGMHAIERILWAGQHPQNVVVFESELLGYVEASFPTTLEEAEEFKTGLAERLTADTQIMRDDFSDKNLALDPPTAFGGVIGSMQEQFEKVNLAATAEDESRYAQRTLDDMRANLEGGKKVYDAFRAWTIESGGEEINDRVEAGFERIEAAYDAIEGPAIPAVPDGFDPDDPSAEHLQTPYGKLFSLLTEESDTRRDDSLVKAMLDAAEAMNISLDL